MSSYQGKLRIGTSGYHYDHWKGVFYPEDLPKTEWFSHYARQFDTVEINNTFYRLPERHDLRRLAAPSSQRVLLCAQVQPLRLAYRAAQKAKRHDREISQARGSAQGVPGADPGATAA